MQAALRGHVARARMLDAMKQGKFVPPAALGRAAETSAPAVAPAAARTAAGGYSSDEFVEEDIPAGAGPSDSDDHF